MAFVVVVVLVIIIVVVAVICKNVTQLDSESTGTGAEKFDSCELYVILF